MDPSELAGVSVGSLGHIYKKTFKELYDDPSESESVDTNEEERIEPTISPVGGGVKEAPKPIPRSDDISVADAEEERDHATLVDTVVGDAQEQQNSNLTPTEEDDNEMQEEEEEQAKEQEQHEGETVDTDQHQKEDSGTTPVEPDISAEARRAQTPDTLFPKEHKTLKPKPKTPETPLVHKTIQDESRYRQVLEIEDNLSSQNQIAERLSEFLTERKSQAETDDQTWAADLYRQGLQAKAEYPWGPSLLRLNHDDLKPFGHFRRHLIMAENLMQENERANMYRRGQLGSRNLDKAFEIRPSTPNYLRTTVTQEVRRNLNLGKRKNKSKVLNSPPGPEVTSGEEEEYEEEVKKPRRSSTAEGKRLNNQRRAKQRKKRQGLTTEQVEANGKVLKRMQNQLAFLRNPRYDKLHERNKLLAKPLHHLMLEGITKTVPEHDASIGASTCFHVPGGKAEFTEYEIGQVYETSIKLHNVSNISRRVRVLPPTTKYFSISLLLYPSDAGAVAPGMACMVKIRFSPESLGDYHDYITVLTENNTRFRVPIEAYRDPPSLSIPAELDCGCCLGGNRKQVVFHCVNQGGNGRFRLLPASEWPNTSTQSYAFRSIDIPPFRVTPSEFNLNKGDSVDIRVDFSPRGSGWGDYEQHFVMICDNCRVKRFTVKGTSCQVKIHITALGTAMVDTSIPFIRPPKVLGFGLITLGNVHERVVRIRNATPIELSFHWVLYEIPNKQQHELLEDDKQSQHQHHHHHHHHHHQHGYHHHHNHHKNKNKKLIPAHMSSDAKEIYVISPSSGKFVANGSIEFNMVFDPRRAGEYKQIAKLVIEDIPPTSVDGVKIKKRRQRHRSFDHSDQQTTVDTRENLAEFSQTQIGAPGMNDVGSGNLVTNSTKSGTPVIVEEGHSEANNTYMGGVSTNIGGGERTDTARRSEASHGESYGGETYRSKNTDFSEGTASELQLINIPCMELTLQGHGAHPKLHVLPRFIQFPGTILVRKSFSETVRLSNQSLSTLAFEWSSPELLNHNLNEKLARNREWLASYDTNNMFQVNVSCRRGTLRPKESLLIEVEFIAFTLGFFDVAVACSFTNGPEQGIQVRMQADVDGPAISLGKPEIDFGLVSVNERAQFTLPFQNLSECPVEYKFETLPADPSGTSIMLASNKNSTTSTSINARIVPTKEKRRKQKRIGKNDGPKHSSISFEPTASGILGPLESSRVLVTCHAGSNPERVRNFVVCHVLDGERRFLAVRGEIQSPKVYIDINGFELGTTYVTVPVVRRVTLVNLSNLQASFTWSQVGGPNDTFDATFEPNQGTLAAKAEQVVKFTFVSSKPGRVSSLFACDVDGMKGPLGFSLKTVSRGLVVTYSLVDDKVSEKDMALDPPVDGAMAKVVPSTKIPILDFGDALNLCTRKRMRLCLQNHSAIPTTFEVAIKSFAASSTPLSLGGSSQSQRGNKRMANSASKSFRAGSSGSSGLEGELQTANGSQIVVTTAGDTSNGGLTRQHQQGSRILGDSHEILNVYKSDGGKVFVSQKLQQHEDREVLGENQGVAFLATKQQGKLMPWRAAIIDLWCFNNLPGRYKDELVCSVQGVSQSRVPMRARVVGCPLTLSRNTVGLNLNGTAGMPRLQWGQVVRNTETVYKVVKVVNSGPMAAQVTWRVEANRGPQADVVNVKIGLRMPEPVTGKVVKGAPPPEYVRVSINPHKELTKSPPFLVEPESQCIPAFGEGRFRVAYQPSQDNQCSHAVMIANGEWLENGEQMSSTSSVIDGLLSVSNSSSAIPNSQPAIRDKSEVPNVSGTAANKEPQTALGAAVSDPGPLSSKQPTKQTKSMIQQSTTSLPAASPSSSSSTSTTALTKHHMASTATLATTTPAKSGESGPRREPMKNCLRLALSGASIQPLLSLDCPMREDGLQHITFAAWSTSPDTDKSFFKTITVVNRTAAWLPCALTIRSPSFVIHDINSNAICSGLTDADLLGLGVSDNQSDYDQAIMAGDQQDQRRKPKVFNLAPGTSVTVCVRFTPCDYRAQHLDVNRQIEQCEKGELVVRYANAEQQNIKLEGTMLQALILVKPALLDFTRVHVEREGRTTLHLTNPTSVDAQWHIEHVPKPNEQTETDDAFCWAFSPRQGVLGAQSLPLESRHAYPPQGYDSNGRRAVLKVKVRFRPSRVGPFKSRFRIVVANGRSAEVLLHGVGSYEEEDDNAVKRVPVPMIEYDWVPSFRDASGELSDLTSSVASLGFVEAESEDVDGAVDEAVDEGERSEAQEGEK